MPTTRRASRRLKAGRNNTSDAKEEKDTKSSGPVSRQTRGKVSEKDQETVEDHDVDVVSLDNEDDDENDEADEEFQEEEEKPKSKVAITRGATRRSSRRKASKSTSKQKQPTRTSTRATRAGKVAKTSEKDKYAEDKDDDDDDDDEEEDEEEEEEEEEEDFDYVVEDEESEAYDPEEDGEKDDDGDDDDDELAANTDVIDVKSDDEASVGSATPSRRTREREVTPRKPRPIRTGDHDDGEYEFDPPSGSEDAEDAEKNLRRESPRNVLSKKKLRKRRSLLKPLSLSLGSDNSSGSEAEEELRETKGRASEEKRKKRTKRTLQRPGARPTSPASSSSSASSASASPSSPASPSRISPGMLTRAYHAKHRDEPETKPFNLDALKHACSKIDIVTYEPLEKKHVVWRSETGKVAHCYNLDTLRQIALSKNKTWMEPPTFLTPMTSTMKSQVLALFGEDALSLESVTESAEKRLLNQVWELQVRQLGTRELHLCPICYELAVEELLADREMKRKQEKSKRKDSTEVVVVDEEEDDDFDESNGEDSEDEGDDGNAKKSTESDAVNPLHVLDHYHDWDGAADMAFFSYMDVKKHLQQDHDIDVKGREEKDLVRDYRLRATDGLVQKYVSRSPKFRDEGNWAAIFWRSNRAYAGIFNMIMDKVDSREMGVRKGGTIFPRAVFQRRSRAIWDDLTGNLGTNDRAEMDAFLVDDDLTSSEDELPSRAGRKRPRNRAVGRRRDAGTADKDEATAAAEGGPSLVDEDEIEQIRILKEYYSKYDEEMGDDEDDDLVIGNGKNPRRKESEDSDDDDDDASHHGKDAQKQKSKKKMKSKKSKKKKMKRIVTPSKRRRMSADASASSASSASSSPDSDEEDLDDGQRKLTFGGKLLASKKARKGKRQSGSEDENEKDEEANTYNAKGAGKSMTKRRRVLDSPDDNDDDDDY